MIEYDIFLLIKAMSIRLLGYSCKVPLALVNAEVLELHILRVRIVELLIAIEDLFVLSVTINC